MGILSQGLRIAPPEAPVTGYMFGKGLFAFTLSSSLLLFRREESVSHALSGVYFADMSSKSANYCFTNKENNVVRRISRQKRIEETRESE